MKLSMDTELNYARLCPGCMRERLPGEIACPVCGFNPAAYQIQPHILPPGAVLKDRYMVGKLLGNGFLGFTHLAFDMRLECALVVREFYMNRGLYRDCSTSMALDWTGVSDFNMNFLKKNYYQFQKMASVMAQLGDLPGIMTVHDYFSQNNTLYYTGDYYTGGNLFDYIKTKLPKETGRSTLSYAETLRLLDPVIRSMIAVHKKGIYHRGISATNLMFDAYGALRLINFNGSGIADPDDPASLIFRYPGFSPLEVYSSSLDQGPWTDIYELAAIIYFCMTGNTPTESAKRMMGEALVHPRKWKIRITKRQWQVLEKAMALSADQRYQNLSVFAADLYGCV